MTVEAVRSSWSASATIRPFLVYLLVVVGQVWLGSSLQGVSLEGSTASVFILAVLLAIGLLPAMVLSWVLVARDAPPPIVRLMLGAGSWAGWGLIIFGVAAVAGSIVLDVGAIAATVVIFGVAGAVFVGLGLAAGVGSPGRALRVVALLTAAAVLVGAVSAAGLGSAV